ncbi:hypothetical protein Mapa_016313 [Marchantia paleacea]|nr:hypothetical protein Mapa_016313 [Marchantia paleacea]
MDEGTKHIAHIYSICYGEHTRRSIYKFKRKGVVSVNCKLELVYEIAVGILNFSWD